MTSARKLNQFAADDIFRRVIAELQAAEEIGGPEGAEYLRLMRRVETEARNRYELAVSSMAAGVLRDFFKGQ